MRMCVNVRVCTHVCVHACTYMNMTSMSLYAILHIILTQYDEEAEHRKAVTSKRRKLDAMEEQWRVSHDCVHLVSTQYTENMLLLLCLYIEDYYRYQAYIVLLYKVTGIGVCRRNSVVRVVDGSGHHSLHHLPQILRRTYK